jgi:SAM-dependent methyltransferase
VTESETGQADWFDRIRRKLEAAYLASEDPRGQSGFRGDEARWHLARGIIVEAISRDGTFLDIGCANGHLMETLTQWAAERGVRIEPYGLDISPDLAALAKRRLPQWADRIFVGNGIDWVAPMRFDYVRTELVYVPEPSRESYVRRLLSEVIVPGGRLIVCSYGSVGRRDPAQAIGDILRGWQLPVSGEAEVIDPSGVALTRVGWTDAV